jgi:predicted MFS family arabinose efflux permease
MIPTVGFRKYSANSESCKWAPKRRDYASLETLHPLVDPPPRADEPRAGSRHAVAAVLLAVVVTWNAGNVGPVTKPLADEFDVSLAAIGLIAGTMLFAASTVASLVGSPIARRIGAGQAAQLACLACVIANLGVAASPWFAGLFPGRFLAGFGTGLGLAVGPMIARALGGVRLVGYFGAGVMLGVAGALGIGSVLQDSGVDWRWAFALSAVIALIPIPLLPRAISLDAPGGRKPGELGRLLRSAPLWRLAALLTATLGIPMVISAWLIHYLAVDGTLDIAVAGLLSFALFGVSAVARVAGARLGSLVPAARLMGLPPVFAAAGLAAVAVEDHTVVAAAAMVAMGFGFSLPYATAVEQLALRFPRARVAALAFCTAWISLLPLVAIPVVGSALGEGRGEAAWLILAALIVASGLVNLPRRSAVSPAGKR